MMARLKWYLDPLSLHQLIFLKKKIGPPLTKFSGSAHAIAHLRYYQNLVSVGLNVPTFLGSAVASLHCVHEQEH